MKLTKQKNPLLLVVSKKKKINKIKCKFMLIVMNVAAFSNPQKKLNFHYLSLSIHNTLTHIRGQKLSHKR